jgi:hypothetical protein
MYLLLRELADQRRLRVVHVRGHGVLDYCRLCVCACVCACACVLSYISYGVRYMCVGVYILYYISCVHSMYTYIILYIHIL